MVALATAALAADAPPLPNAPAAPAAPAGPPPRVVLVGNGIRAPGAYRFETNMTLTQAIGASGGIGFNPRVYLIRDGKSLPIHLSEIQKDPRKDILLQPWDIIYAYFGDD